MDLFDELFTPGAAAPAGTPTPDEITETITPTLDGEQPTDGQAPEGEQPAEGETEETQEGEPTEEETPTEEDLFSEAALSTPEGIARAREHLQQERLARQEEARKSHERHLKLKRWEIKSREERKAFRAEKENILRLNQRLASDVEALRTGDANAALTALGRLAGVDGRKLFEQLSVHVATNGKAPKPSREVEELRSEIEALREERRLEQLQAQQRDAKAFIEQRKNEMLSAASNAETYPALAHFVQTARAEIAETLIDLKEQAHQRGEPLSDEEALTQLERQLKPHMPPSQGGKPVNPEAGRDTSGQKATKPTTVGAKPGTSLAPSLATSAPSTRALTEAERTQALANDPEFLRMIGF